MNSELIFSKINTMHSKKNAGKILKFCGPSEISHVGILLFDLQYMVIGQEDWKLRNGF